MKLTNYFILINIFLFCVSCVSVSKDQRKSEGTLNKSKKETSLFTTIKSIGLETYIGRPVGELLQDIPAYNTSIAISEPPGILQGFTFVYPNRLYLHVYTDSLNYLDKENFNQDWDFQLFQKEVISKIKLDQIGKTKNTITIK